MSDRPERAISLHLLVVVIAGFGPDCAGRCPECLGEDSRAGSGGPRADVTPAPLTGASGTQSDWERSGVWRAANKCSVNALYVALRLQHVKLKYADAERTMQVNAAGSSLADLHRCAGEFGMSSVMLRITPDALSQSHLPCVAHLEEERSVTGHFVVVVAAGREWVEYIDGTTVATHLVSMSEFRKSWTGYVLMFEHPPWWKRLLPAAGLLGVTAMFLAGVRRFGARRSEDQQAAVHPTVDDSGHGNLAAASNRFVGGQHVSDI
jgi:hypothetical protein